MSSNYHESENIFFEAVTELHGENQPFVDLSEGEILESYFPDGEFTTRWEGFAFPPGTLKDMSIGPNYDRILALINLPNGRARWIVIESSAMGIIWEEPETHKVYSQ